MDVDLSKIIRRIDKFTAALVSLYVGRPVMNYDVYPETRSTSATHELLKVRVRVRVSLRIRVSEGNRVSGFERWLGCPTPVPTLSRKRGRT